MHLGVVHRASCHIVVHILLFVLLLFILFFFEIRNVKSLKNDTLKTASVIPFYKDSFLTEGSNTVLSTFSYFLFILVGDDLNQFAVLDNCDAHRFEVLLDLLFNVVVIFKSIWVNEVHVFINLHIVVLVYVDILVRNGKSDALGLDTTVKHALDHSVAVQGTTVDHAVGLASAVSKLAHDLSVFLEV